MFSSSRRSSMLAAIAAFAIAASAPPVRATQPAMASAAPRAMRDVKRSLLGGVRASMGLYGRKGSGITTAQQKRAARKARNIARNRRHTR